MALTPEQLAELQRLRKVFVPLAEQARRDSQRQDNMDKMNPQNKGKGGSVLKDLEAYIRQRHGDSGAKRVQRASDEVKGLEGMFNEKALREAFDDKKTALMAMNPADFENFATPLSSWHTDPESTRHTRSGDKLNFEEYLQHLARLQGFDSVPYLDLFKSKHLPFANISGHEGRHRNRVMAKKGIDKSLVQLRPAYEYRKDLPNETQEEFLAALQDKLGRKPFVLPQNTMNGETRKQIIMPENFSKGGPLSQDAMRLALAKGGSITHAHQLEIEERPL